MSPIIEDEIPEAKLLVQSWELTQRFTTNDVVGWADTADDAKLALRLMRRSDLALEVIVRPAPNG